MHSGCTLLVRPLEVLISPFGAMHTGSSLLTGAKRYIMPFSDMHADSSLLTDGQQRAKEKRYNMPFGAMHAVSSLLTDGQQRDSSSEQNTHKPTTPITHGFLTEKEYQQLLQDEEVLGEILEEQARAEKEWEDRIKKEEVERELFILEFGVYTDSEYETD
ncbi:hypothetical protein Tco_0827254 [Tanacetum coccineum]